MTVNPNTTVTLTSIRKDYYNLSIGTNAIGTFERSELRHILEQIDNKVSV
tara:strand:- start:160 stop:309 length:150 start_codon:yes stop_codon:yes gene_type:complete